MSTALSALLRTKVARVGNTPVDSPTALTAQVDFEVLKATGDRCVTLLDDLCHLTPEWEEDDQDREEDRVDDEGDAILNIDDLDETGGFDGQLLSRNQSRLLEEKLRSGIGNLLTVFEESSVEDVLRGISGDMNNRMTQAIAEISSLEAKETELNDVSKRLEEDCEALEAHVWEREINVCDTLENFRKNIRGHIHAKLKRAQKAAFSEKTSKKRWKSYHQDESAVFDLELKVSRMKNKLNTRKATLAKVQSGVFVDIEAAQAEAKEKFESESQALHAIIDKQQHAISASNATLRKQQKEMLTLEEMLESGGATMPNTIGGGQAGMSSESKTANSVLGDGAASGGIAGSQGPGTGDAPSVLGGSASNGGAGMKRTAAVMTNVGGDFTEQIRALRKTRERLQDELQDALAAPVGENELSEADRNIIEAEGLWHEAQQHVHGLTKEKSKLEESLKERYQGIRNIQRLSKEVDDQTKAIKKLRVECRAVGLTLPEDYLEPDAKGEKKDLTMMAMARVLAAKKTHLRRRAEALFAFQKVVTDLEKAEKERQEEEDRLQAHEDEERELLQKLDSVHLKDADNDGEGEDSISSMTSSSSSTSGDDGSHTPRLSGVQEDVPEEGATDVAASNIPVPPRRRKSSRLKLVARRMSKASASRNNGAGKRRRSDGLQAESQGTDEDVSATYEEVEKRAAALDFTIRDATAVVLGKAVAATRAAGTATSEANRVKLAAAAEQALEEVYSWKDELKATLAAEEASIAEEEDLVTNISNGRGGKHQAIAQKIERAQAIHSEAQERVGKSDEEFHNALQRENDSRRDFDRARAMVQLFRIQVDECQQAFEQTEADSAENSNVCRELEAAKRGLSEILMEETAKEDALKAAQQTLNKCKKDLSDNFAGELLAQQRLDKAVFEREQHDVDVLVASVAKNAVDTRRSLHGVKTAFVRFSSDSSTLSFEQGVLATAMKVEQAIVGTLREHDAAYSSLKVAQMDRDATALTMAKALELAETCHVSSENSVDWFFRVAKTDAEDARANAAKILFRFLAVGSLDFDGRRDIVQAIVDAELHMGRGTEGRVRGTQKCRRVAQAIRREERSRTLLEAEKRFVARHTIATNDMLADLDDDVQEAAQEALDLISNSLKAIEQGTLAKVAAKHTRDPRVRREGSVTAAKLLTAAVEASSQASEAVAKSLSSIADKNVHERVSHCFGVAQASVENVASALELSANANAILQQEIGHSGLFALESCRDIASAKSRELNATLGRCIHMVTDEDLLTAALESRRTADNSIHALITDYRAERAKLVMKDHPPNTELSALEEIVRIEVGDDWNTRREFFSAVFGLTAQYIQECHDDGRLRVEECYETTNCIHQSLVNAVCNARHEVAGYTMTNMQDMTKYTEDTARRILKREVDTAASDFGDKCALCRTARSAMLNKLAASVKTHWETLLASTELTPATEEEVVGVRGRITAAAKLFWDEEENAAMERDSKCREKCLQTATAAWLNIYAALECERICLSTSGDRFTVVALQQAAEAKAKAEQGLLEARQAVLHDITVEEQQREEQASQRIEQANANMAELFEAYEVNKENALSRVLESSITFAAQAAEGERIAEVARQRHKMAEDEAFKTAWDSQLAHAQAVATANILLSMYTDKNRATIHIMSSAARTCEKHVKEYALKRSSQTGEPALHDHKACANGVKESHVHRESTIEREISAKSSLNEADTKLREYRSSILHHEKRLVASMESAAVHQERMSSITKRIEETEIAVKEAETKITKANEWVNEAMVALTATQTPKDRAEAQSEVDAAHDRRAHHEATLSATLSALRGLKGDIKDARTAGVAAQTTAQESKDAVAKLQGSGVEAGLQRDVEAAKQDMHNASLERRTADAVVSLREVKSEILGRLGLVQMTRFENLVSRASAMEASLVAIEETWMQANVIGDRERAGKAELELSQLCDECDDFTEAANAAVVDNQTARDKRVSVVLKGNLGSDNSDQAAETNTLLESAAEAIDAADTETPKSAEGLRKRASLLLTTNKQARPTKRVSIRGGATSLLTQIELFKAGKKKKKKRAEGTAVDKAAAEAKSKRKQERREARRNERRKQRAAERGDVDVDVIRIRLTELATLKESHTNKISKLNSTIGILRADSSASAAATEESKLEQSYLHRMARIRRENAALIDQIVERQGKLSHLSRLVSLLRHKAGTLERSTTLETSMVTQRESLELTKTTASAVMARIREQDELGSQLHSTHSKRDTFTTSVNRMNTQRKAIATRMRSLGGKHSSLLKQRWRVQQKIDSLSNNLRVGGELKKLYQNRRKLEDEQNRLALRVIRANKARAEEQAVSGGRPMSDAETKADKVLRGLRRQIQWWETRWKKNEAVEQTRNMLSMMEDKVGPQQRMPRTKSALMQSAARRASITMLLTKTEKPTAVAPSLENEGSRSDVPTSLVRQDSLALFGAKRTNEEEGDVSRKSPRVRNIAQDDTRWNRWSNVRKDKVTKMEEGATTKKTLSFGSKSQAIQLFQSTHDSLHPSPHTVSRTAAPINVPGASPAPGNSPKGKFVRRGSIAPSLLISTGPPSPLLLNAVAAHK